MRKKLQMYSKNSTEFLKISIADYFCLLSIFVVELIDFICKITRFF